MISPTKDDAALAGAAAVKVRASVKTPNDTPDWEALHAEHRAALTGERLAALAATLGVDADALWSVGVGWCKGLGVYTFAEVDGAGGIIGMATRSPDGGKRAITGSKRGLTMMRDFESLPGPALVVEGASDVAACGTMSLPAIGRPSCRGGVDHLAAALKGRPVLIVGENDKGPGRAGAEAVAQRLAAEWGEPVAWALPPAEAKDARAWLGARVAAGLDLSDRAACAQAGEELRDALLAAAITCAPRGKAGDPDADAGAGAKRETNAHERLVALASERAELFRAEDDRDTAYASVDVGGVRRTMPVRSRAFRGWLQREHRELHGGGVRAQALDDAIGELESAALFDGAEHPVALRVAERDGVQWVDLADESGRVVRVTREGWSVCEASECPIRFHRRAAMLPLPEPERGGSVNELRSFVNVDDEHWPVALAWLVGALRPRGPFYILELSGEPGSAKSTTARMLRALVDPNRAPIRAEPREARDLALSAGAAHVLALDNLTRLQPWLSEGLCRLATGGAFVTRRLYSDAEEVIFEAERPAILTGVGEVCAASDLIDRTLRLQLEPIADTNRRAERDLEADFERARPRILGALLDALVCALNRIDGVDVRALRARMADAAAWAVAAEPALGLVEGAMAAALGEARQAAHEAAVAASPIGPALVALVRGAGEWRGTFAGLQADLARFAPESLPRDWPRSPRSLSALVRYIARDLRAMGFGVLLPSNRGRAGRELTLIAPYDDGGGESRHDAHNAHDAHNPPSEAGEAGGACASGASTPGACACTPENAHAENPLSNPERGDCAHGARCARAAGVSPPDLDTGALLAANHARGRALDAEHDRDEAERQGLVAWQTVYLDAGATPPDDLSATDLFGAAPSNNGRHSPPTPDTGGKDHHAS